MRLRVLGLPGFEMMVRGVEGLGFNVDGCILGGYRLRTYTRSFRW